jgi:hypothetical protein
VKSCFLPPENNGRNHSGHMGQLHIDSSLTWRACGICHWCVAFRSIVARPCPFRQKSPHTHPAERRGPTYTHACTGLSLGGDAGVGRRGCHKAVTRLLQGCHEGVTRVIQGCHKGVTRCYKGVTRVLRGCYNNVTRVLHLSYNGAEITSSVSFGCWLCVIFGSRANVSGNGTTK